MCIHSLSLAARYRVAACSSILRRGLEKVNEAREHNCTPLFALSPAWERDFLFPSMTFHTANAFDNVCRLDRDDILDEVPQTKSKRLTLVSFWRSCLQKTLLGSWDQSAVIVLLTLCHIIKESRVLRALGYLLASSASSATDYALHRDFTLRRTSILAVLDVQMHLTPSLTTMSVPDCTTSSFQETRHDGATKKLLVTRLDLLGVPVEPSTWYDGSGLP